MAKPGLRRQIVTSIPDQLDLAPTAGLWVETVMADFPSFLQDHASCEKKASGMALSVASHYPDRPRLLNAMADLAVEELTHYREVVRLLIARGLQPSSDAKDNYVRGFNAAIRKGSEEYLLDRLLVAAVIEARGHERFGLIASALPEGADRRFYQAITASEGRHWHLFVELAIAESNPNWVQPRLAELVALEADLMAAQPLAPRLH